MLLGRTEQQLVSSLERRPGFACPELQELVSVGHTALGEVGTMGRFLRIAAPRLQYCKASSPLDWYCLGVCSQYAQVLGNRYLVKNLARFAAANANLAEDDYSQVQCLSTRLPDGETKLHSALRLLGSYTGYFMAIRLGTEAYWRGDLRILDAALERVKSQQDNDSAGAFLANSTLELLQLQSCRDKLVNRNANLVDILHVLSQTKGQTRKVYELDTMHLLLSDADPATIGMLASGFGLFSSTQDAQG